MLEFVAYIPGHGMSKIVVVVVYGLWYSCCSVSHHLCRHVRRLYQENVNSFGIIVFSQQLGFSSHLTRVF
jgi:hypothetical protein